MKQVSIFIVTSTRSPGKTKKAWYRYMMYCDGHNIDKKQKGYYIDPDSIRMGINPVTGYAYRHYTLIKLDRRI